MVKITVKITGLQGKSATKAEETEILRQVKSQISEQIGDTYIASLLSDKMIDLFESTISVDYSPDFANEVETLRDENAGLTETSRKLAKDVKDFEQVVKKHESEVAEAKQKYEALKSTHEFTLNLAKEQNVEWEKARWKVANLKNALKEILD